MLRIWGRRSVANVQKVTWCVGELGIPHEHLDHGWELTRACDNAYVDYKGRDVMPVMDDDGFVLWEGNAIARYLAAKHADRGLWPDDPRQRADAERWMDYQLSTVRVPIHALMRDELSTSQKAHHTAELAKVMQVVEFALADRDYLLGPDFTVADIPLGIVTYRWTVLDIERASLPNVEAWYDRLSSRPAFRDHMFPPEESHTGLRPGGSPG